MMEAVTAILGLFCVGIFVAHAVDAYLMPQGARECPKEGAPARGQAETVLGSFANRRGGNDYTAPKRFA